MVSLPYFQKMATNGIIGFVTAFFCFAELFLKSGGYTPLFVYHSLNLQNYEPILHFLPHAPIFRRYNRRTNRFAF